MGAKLDKAQTKYEKLLRELGHRAEMVGMFERADAGLLDAYRKAQNALADRKVEMEFLDSEIERMEEEARGDRQEIEQEIAALKDSIKTTEKSIGVKKHKLGPLRKELAGSEYDFKFAERALEEEKRKKKNAEEIEDTDKAAEHDKAIKRMKIEILKRKKKIAELRKQVEAIENPAKDMKGNLAETQARIKELQARLSQMAKSGEHDEVLEDLRRQKAEKQKDIDRTQQHLLDCMADVGEDLYEQRIKHSVLAKYYADIDEVAKLIDELQAGAEEG